MGRSGSRVSQIASQRRWSEDEARVVLEAAQSSGLGLAAFATSVGLDAQRLYRWRRALRDREPAPPQFAEVVVRPATPTPRSAPLELTAPSGHVVRLPCDFDERTLRRVLVVLCEFERSC